MFDSCSYNFFLYLFVIAVVTLNIFGELLTQSLVGR